LQISLHTEELSLPGKTDRIDLVTFYPLLAGLAIAARAHPDKPIHPALSHVIVNTPNPGVSATVFSDNSAAKLILLGEPIPVGEAGGERWWPTASTPSVRMKLYRRILCEGYLLPILTSLCIGLLAEMYTTTAVTEPDSPDGNLRRRVRLQYNSSPISDFGIAKAIADVKDQDKLAYFNFSDDTFEKGQDPNDHYLLYFTTIRGEEFILDLGMFTFNLCFNVRLQPYKFSFLPPGQSHAPAFFGDRTITRNAPNLFDIRQRFSFLHNEALHRAVEHSGDVFRSADSKTICEFMESIAGRRCTASEKDLVMEWSNNNCRCIDITLEERLYKEWKPPSVNIEVDPGEMDETPEEDLEWWKYMKKWNRKYKRGQISSQALGDAFRAWETRHRSAQLAEHLASARI
jgi:hypothetical protein